MTVAAAAAAPEQMAHTQMLARLAICDLRRGCCLARMRCSRISCPGIGTGCSIRVGVEASWGAGLVKCIVVRVIRVRRCSFAGSCRRRVERRGRVGLFGRMAGGLGARWVGRSFGLGGA